MKCYSQSSGALFIPKSDRWLCTVAYSSTCPCSAALARQLIQQKFLADFPDQDSFGTDQIHDWLGTEEAILATPHSQRSYADVKVKIIE